MPDSQQPLTRTITVPEVQERNTVKRIHQLRRLAAACAPREVMANTPTDESRSHMSKLQSRMISRLSLDNPEIHGCYGPVIGEATTYKRGMTVPELQPNATASNHCTGSVGRKHLGAHLPAENRSWRLVDEHTLEEITSRVKKHVEKSRQCTWR